MRKPSPETRLRHLRREFNAMCAELQAVRSELGQRRSCGGAMANVCYNLARMTALGEHNCETVDRLRREWDAIKRVP